jgi:hypothetical protein
MGNPKLTIEQVKKIKRAMHNGANAHAQAYLYGVDVTNIRGIHIGRYYKNVLPELTRPRRKYKWITTADRVKVLNDLARGKTYVAIGKRYKRHPAIISRIRKGL